MKIMFGGTMNSVKYGKTIEAGLVPFVRTSFPDGHRLQQLGQRPQASIQVKYTLVTLLNSMVFISVKPLRSYQTLTQLRIGGVL